MLATIEPAHNDFAALAAYLIHGRDRPTDSKRVAWVMPHNLSTDDPMRAAAIMAAFAERSARCRNACYHLSINCHPDERPMPETMQEIARRTLELAGLGEHQALVMGHGDKPHAHLHMMINRVHPDTGRAWSTSHDYRRFDRIMKQLAEEHGFRYVAPHSFEPELTDELPKGPNSNATYAARRGTWTTRPQWSRRASRDYGRRLSEHLDHASGWDDLEYLLAEDGLSLEPKGKGLVIGNRQSYTKLSAVPLHTGARNQARRFTPKGYAAWKRSRPRPPNRSPWTVDAVDIARAIGDRADVRRAIQEAVGARKARLAKAPLMKQLMEELKERLKVMTGLSPSTRRSQLASRLSRRHSSGARDR